MKQRYLRFVCLTLIAAAAACAHYPTNPPLAQQDSSKGYRFGTLQAPPEADETLVILSFSGGGTRAASLAYGVLNELANQPIAGGTKKLVDHVAVISSVSGGSFTSTYYALYGTDGLKTFPEVFLYQNVQGALIRSAFLTPNIFKLLSPNYSRIDVAAEYYDKHVFDHKTFGDLEKRNRRPFVLLNSTEMDIGTSFEWSQDQFDAICSDLSPVHVARGVAASSAFPGLLTPLTLKSYPGKCGYRDPPWVGLALKDELTNAPRYRDAVLLRELGNEDRKYIHLLDGGLADNIGLRRPMRALESTDTAVLPAKFGFSILRLIDMRRVKRIAVVTVNAAIQGGVGVDAKERTPGIVKVLGAVSGTPMSSYSFDTIALLQRIMQEWNAQQKQRDDCRALAKESCPTVDIPPTQAPHIDSYNVNVAFGFLPDRKERNCFYSIGTNFGLPRDQVTALINVGPRLLHLSGDYARLVKDLGGDVTWTADEAKGPQPVEWCPKKK
jgi:NTE family protein